METHPKRDDTFSSEKTISTRTPLDEVFGSEGANGLEHLSRTFNLDDVIACSEVSRPAYSVMVPDLASINHETINALEETDKVAVASVLNAISLRTKTDNEAGMASDHPAATITWGALQDELMQAPFLERGRAASVPRSLETYSKQVRWFKFANPHCTLDSNVIRRLVLDLAGRTTSDASEAVVVDPLIQLLSIQTDEFEPYDSPEKRTIASRPLDAMTTLSEYTERMRKAFLVEVRTLGFPTPQDRRFTISRLRLFGWMTHDQRLIMQKSVTGITTEHICRHFTARESLVMGLDPGIREEALHQVEALLASGGLLPRPPPSKRRPTVSPSGVVSNGVSTMLDPTAQLNEEPASIEPSDNQVMNQGPHAWSRSFRKPRNGSKGSGRTLTNNSARSTLATSKPQKQRSLPSKLSIVSKLFRRPPGSGLRHNLTVTKAREEVHNQGPEPPQTNLQDSPGQSQSRPTQDVDAIQEIRRAVSL